MSDRKPPTSSEVAGPSGLQKPPDNKNNSVSRVLSPEKPKEQLKMNLNLAVREDAPSPGGSTSTSPRRAVSPLLEVRRPICTLKCDNCSYALFHRFGLIPGGPDTSKYFFLLELNRTV